MLFPPFLRLGSDIESHHACRPCDVSPYPKSPSHRLPHLRHFAFHTRCYMVDTFPLTVKVAPQSSWPKTRRSPIHPRPTSKHEQSTGTRPLAGWASIWITSLFGRDFTVYIACSGCLSYACVFPTSLCPPFDTFLFYLGPSSCIFGRRRASLTSVLYARTVVHITTIHYISRISVTAVNR